MISPKALLFLAIQQKIASILNNDNVTRTFPFVERDLGQIDNGSRPPVVWPATVIRIIEGKFEEMGNNAQSGVYSVSVRIAFPPYSATSDKTPATYRNKALQYFELEQIMYKNLQGWAPEVVTVKPAEGGDQAITADITDIFGALTRVYESEEDREDFLTVCKQIFTIGIDDFSASKDIVYTPVTPSISDIIDMTIEV